MVTTSDVLHGGECEKRKVNGSIVDKTVYWIGCTGQIAKKGRVVAGKEPWGTLGIETVRVRRRRLVY